MIKRLPPAFEGMQAVYYDPDTMAPVVNARGELATDSDVDRAIPQAEWDRLTIEMCKAERAAGNRIPAWLLEGETAAFKRSLRKAG